MKNNEEDESRGYKTKINFALFLGGTGLGASIALLFTVVFSNYGMAEKITASVLFAAMFGIMTTYAVTYTVMSEKQKEGRTRGGIE